MTIERREHFAEVRAVTEGDNPGVTLACIRPGVVDDYGSLWMPDVFDASLTTRLPTLCWSHDWSEPLGHGVGFRTSDQGPEVDFVFDNFDDVPQARRAHSQVRSGTIADCSVGFSNVDRRSPTPQEVTGFPGVKEVILKADLDEVSLVLRGAVPGAKVLAVRTASGTVAESLLDAYARKVAAGDMTVEEAKAALTIAADDEPVAPPSQDEVDANTPPEPPPPDEPDDDAAALAADLDAAIALTKEH